MAKIHPRWDGENQWYFVTVVTQQREPVFSDSNKCEILKKSFKEVRNYHSFRLAGLAILPDHWHGLVNPEPPNVIEKIVGAVKQNFLRKIWKQDSRQSIWQARFLDRRIRDMEDFNFHLEYIRVNAVKHGYVEKVEDWPWINIHANPFGLS